MALRGKRPEGGVGVASWTFDNVPQGAWRVGWLAGPIHALVCHCSRTTKPCRRLLLGSTADCEGCDRHQRGSWVGYVPLKRDDGRPFVVAIHESTFSVVDRISPGARVRWGRNQGQGEGVWIRDGEAGRGWNHYWPDERPAHVLTHWLVRLWRMPDITAALEETFREECQPTVTVAPQPPAAEPLPPPPEEVPDRVKVLEAEIASTTLDDTIASIRRKARRMGESKNGVH